MDLPSITNHVLSYIMEILLDISTWGLTLKLAFGFIALFALILLQKADQKKYAKDSQ